MTQKEARLAEAMPPFPGISAEKDENGLVCKNYGFIYLPLHGYGGNDKPINQRNEKSLHTMRHIFNYCCPVNMCKGLQSLIFLLYKPPLKGN